MGLPFDELRDSALLLPLSVLILKTRPSPTHHDDRPPFHLPWNLDCIMYVPTAVVTKLRWRHPACGTAKPRSSQEMGDERPWTSHGRGWLYYVMCLQIRPFVMNTVQPRIGHSRGWALRGHHRWCQVVSTSQGRP